MLAANVCAADFMLQAESPCPLPRARGPLGRPAGQAARTSCAALGLGLGRSATSPAAADYGKLLRAGARAAPTPRLLQPDAAALHAARPLYTPDEHRPLRPGLSRPTPTSPARSAATRTCWCTA
jgi:exoribonuclease R